jgi:puromycin-sensitive aminopeptidase
MFDLLTYEKGAGVLRMLEQSIGATVFRDGVRRYLEHHRYGNAETTDLWKALGEASGLPIPEIMDAWIFRPGYPLVSVEADGTGVKVSQRRFTYLGAEGNPDERWRIPIALRASVKGGWVDKRLLLGEAETRVELPAAPEWVLANTGGHGFFRVGTPSPCSGSWRARWPRCRPSTASTWPATPSRCPRPASCRGGVSGADRPLSRGAGPQCLDGAHGSFGFLNRVLPDRARPGLEAFVRHRVGPAAARLGWDREDGESELVRQLRGDLLRILGTLGNDEETQAQARAMWARYVEDESALDPNVLPAVIAILASTGWGARIRGLSPALPHRAEPAGRAALPLRPGRLPRARAHQADPRANSQWRSAKSGRALPDPVHAGLGAMPAPWPGVSSRSTGKQMARQYPAAPTGASTRASPCS